MAVTDHRQGITQINNIKNNKLNNIMSPCNEINEFERCECLEETKCIDFNMNNTDRLSDIQEFYNGKNILITGSTGFLGKILVEKLLRCCPRVEGLYLLVRQKKGKDIYTRMEEIFNDPVFDRLKKETPSFKHKVNIIPADCEATGLGLSIADRQMLIEKVNVIFHSAATVKFDEHLRAALVTNVCAPLHLLQLAREINNLVVMMHISTAYSNCHLARVEERFYPCEADCETLQAMIDKLTDRQINTILPKILGAWPNTYTFTKALAEKEIRRNVGGVPVGIFRPAIITSTAREPLKCWLDNMYGPTGVAAGCATGILRTIQCDPSVTADIIPVDLTVNCLLAAAKSVHTSYNQSPPPQEPPIYNYVSSAENRITWGEFIETNTRKLNAYPFSEAIWFMSLMTTKSAFINSIYILFLHLIPAVLIDGLCLCLGRKPKMLKVYQKIHKFSSVLAYFSTKEIIFCNQRTKELWEETSEVDKELFPFNIGGINWDEYFEEYMAGIRRYLFKESDDTLPWARIKWKRLYYLHQIARVFFFALFIYVLWTIFSILLIKI